MYQAKTISYKDGVSKSIFNFYFLKNITHVKARIFGLFLFHKYFYQFNKILNGKPHSFKRRQLIFCDKSIIQNLKSHLYIKLEINRKLYIYKEVLISI